MARGSLYGVSRMLAGVLWLWVWLAMMRGMVPMVRARRHVRRSMR